jgi:hypothetical protein
VNEVSERAKLKVAQVQLKKGSLSDAILNFRDLLRRSDRRSILCGAAVGLGDARILEMKKANNMTSSGIRDALESYLEAVVLYFPEGGDPAAIASHQTALIKAAQYAEALMTNSKEKEQEGFHSLARDLYRDITSSYPGTETAKKAQDALKKLSQAQ